MNRYILSEHAQGTPEWKKDRVGRATGSCASKILAKIKTGEAADRRNYRTQLVVERLTGNPADDCYVTPAMQWGTEQEPFARMSFEASTGLLVEEAGFAYLPDIKAGCSVDGFILQGDRFGIFECKCPLSATHITYLTERRLPPAYLPQVLHNLYVTGAEFADFVSFDPRMPERLQLFTHRYMRDEKAIQQYETELNTFLREVGDMVETLMGLTIESSSLATQP